MLLSSVEAKIQCVAVIFETNTSLQLEMAVGRGKKTEMFSSGICVSLIRK